MCLKVAQVRGSGSAKLARKGLLPWICGVPRTKGVRAGCSMAAALAMRRSASGVSARGRRGWRCTISSPTLLAGQRRTTRRCAPGLAGRVIRLTWGAVSDCHVHLAI